MLNTRHSCLPCLLVLLLVFSHAQAEIILDITGVDDSLKDEIISGLVISRISGNNGLTEARVRALFHRSLGEINKILRSNGYYEFSVSENLEQSGENWVARYEISPGEPVLISTVSITLTGEGKTDPDFTQLIRDFPLSSGDQLNHETYEASKRRFQGLAQEKGYFDASFTEHIIRLDRPGKSATITLTFSTGTRYEFGDIKIDDTVVSRERINRMIPFKSGDKYDTNQLIKINQNLRDSNYFNEVVVEPDIASLTDHKVPVVIKLSPRPRNNYKIGAGYGTDSGPRVIAGWENRYLNREGQKIEANLKGSTSLNILSVKHTTPDFRRSGADLDLLSSISRETPGTHTSNTFIFGGQQNRRRGSWNETLSLSYQYENFEVGGEETDSNLLIPGISYWKTSSDNLIYTNKGFRLNFNLKGSLNGALSNVSFIQSTVSGKYIFPLGADGRLISRGELGATAVNGFDDLPASIRYFAGGNTSVRGFDFQTQGPVNNNGEVIGGKYLAVGSLEYEHKIYEKISLAVFSDYGNAFNSFSDHFVYGAGVGVRLLTPVGLVRLDFAFGLSEDPAPFRIHFEIGPDL